MSAPEKADLVIIGAGPAGLSAAIEARRAGVGSVVVLDEGTAPGGQIFRRYGPGFSVIDPSKAGHEYRDGQALIALRGLLGQRSPGARGSESLTPEPESDHPSTFSTPLGGTAEPDRGRDVQTRHRRRRR